MKQKNRGLCPALLLACLLLLAGCGENAAGGASDTSSADEAAAMNASAMDLTFSARDMDVGYEESTAVAVTLNGSSITVSGDGATAEGSTLTISREGTYVLSGSLTDGQIIINTGDSEKVQLVLNGATIHCEDHAAIYVLQSDKVFLTLAEGTENTLSGGETVTLTGQDESNVDGVIFSKSDFTVNGSGSLTVIANYEHGIVSKDDLIITGGMITIEAVGQAINGKDCVKIADGTFVLSSGGDAIQSDNTEDETRGFIYIRSGSFAITAGTDAIQAETMLRIDDGDFQITTGGGSANASTKSSGEASPGWGKWGGSASSDETAAAADDIAEESSSAKGLKAGALVQVNGGSFTIDSSDDSIHSNGDAKISGGEFAITSGDDGLHADADVTVSGGTLTVSKSYEGMEGANILISGGKIGLTATDDGINAAGGNDGSALGGRPGQGSFVSGTEYIIRITGGEVAVSASGDGIDANGAIYIEGGTVRVDGPTADGNSALDYEQTAQISGGTFIGVGSSGMAQSFSDGSSQCSLMVNLNAAAEAGTEVVLTDSAGKTIASHTAEKSFRSVIISTPALTDGESYTLTAGGQTIELTLSGSVTTSGSGGGMFGGGGQRPDNGDFTQPDGQLPAGTESGGMQRPGRGEMTPPEEGTQPPEQAGETVSG